MCCRVRLHFGLSKSVPLLKASMGNEKVSNSIHSICRPPVSEMNFSCRPLPRRATAAEGRNCEWSEGQFYSHAASLLMFLISLLVDYNRIKAYPFLARHGLLSFPSRYSFGLFISAQRQSNSPSFVRWPLTCDTLSFKFTREAQLASTRGI